MLLRRKPANPKAIEFIPIFFPINKSISSPKIAPRVIPYILPKNKPINKISIINKFGFIPAILNHVKKFDCRKYMKINVKNIIIIESVFFTVVPFL